MVAQPNFDYILALEWANFNICTWDLFYMIDMHKLYNTRNARWAFLVDCTYFVLLYKYWCEYSAVRKNGRAHIGPFKIGPIR